MASEEAVRLQQLCRQDSDSRADAGTGLELQLTMTTYRVERKGDNDADDA